VYPETRQLTFIPGEAGPKIRTDEARRHIYKRDGQAVRIKVKRSSGSYVNWYRVLQNGEVGWQPAKPTDYQPCPYFGEFDPFDPEFRSEPLFWPEGEKDCDTLSKLGFPAFTFGGTGDGLPDGIEVYLKDRDIIILADNDPAGITHAERKALLAQPVARSVKVIHFPELPAKADVSDFLVTATVADLEKRVADSAPWERQPAAENGWRKATMSASDLRDKVFSPIKFIIPEYVPEGVTIFAGKPKIGKSWFLYDVCLATATGRFVLGAIKPAEGDVLYLALEDSARRLKQRLQKLWPDGNWPHRLKLATQWRKADAGGLADIAGWCDAVSKPVLVVIDTLEKFRPQANASLRAYSLDYAAVEGLHKLAHERGIAIVVIHHVRKMDAEDPFDMVSGTNGLTGAADTILVLKRQASNVILYARGRDIDEKETACSFDKLTCRWMLLGDANEVRGSKERAQIIEALCQAPEAGMNISEIMAATQRRDRNGLDQLLFKMQHDGEIVRLKRGIYAMPGKNSKKERDGS